MAQDAEFACRIEIIDGQPVMRRLSVRTPKNISVREHHVSKLDMPERSVIWTFCERQNCLDDFPYLLHKAEERCLEHRKHLAKHDFNLAAKEGSGYQPVNDSILRSWLIERRQPRLF